MKKQVNIVILGPPGSGKGAQAELIADYMQLELISLGEMLRKEQMKGSRLGKNVSEVIDAGNLIPTLVATDMIKKQLGSKRKGVLFDGFPRSLAEAKFLEKLLSVDFVFFLDIPKSMVITRLKSRVVCECGRIYNALSKKPKYEMECDRCGARLFRRNDDVPVAIEQRLKVYAREMPALAKYYEQKKVFHKIDGTVSVRKVFLRVKKVLRGGAHG